MYAIVNFRIPLGLKMMKIDYKPQGQVPTREAKAQPSKTCKQCKITKNMHKWTILKYVFSEVGIVEVQVKRAEDS
jgi:hypothetical protein